MKKTHSRHLSTGSRRSNQSGESTNSNGSIVSRVLGSFRHPKKPRCEDQPPSQAEADKKNNNSNSSKNWVTDYKPTHYPDRPRVDKRTRTKLSDAEYADSIQKMQKRSQRYYHHAGSRRRTPTSLQTNVPNFSYSSRSPKSNRESPPALAFARTEWLPPPRDNRDRDRGSRSAESEEGKNRNIGEDSPCSPGAVEIQVYHEESLGPGIGISVRETPDCEKPRPSKAFEPAEPAETRKPRGRTGHQRRSSSAPRRTTAVRASATSVYLDPIPSSPSVSNTDLTSDSLPETSTTTSVTTVNPPTPPPAEPRRCPMPGCGTPLTTDADKRHNLCGGCRRELQPRESTFLAAGARESSNFDDEEDAGSVVIAQADLKTFRALGDARVNIVDNKTRATERQRPECLASKFSGGGPKDFKLQAPPPPRRGRGKLRVVATRRGRSRSRSKSRSRRKVSSASSSRSSEHSHIGFQLANWGDGGEGKKETPEQASEVPALEVEEGGGLTSADDESLRTTSSWSTGLRTSVGTFGGDPGRRRGAGGPAAPPKGGNCQDAPVVRVRANSGDDHIYREIDEIIECYVNAEVMSPEQNEHRKADAIASYFAEDPEDVEMKKKGFF
ncbi:hypothetical protein F4779DRAFT_244072 [Xylariaceae sp. FL0662B]|nr:hypothetical protein F4779DRAFT_244072 [Xylariaceae sp. FL0662B]